MNAQRIQRIFAQVANLLPAQRPAMLDRLCADDSQIRREVESLLANHDNSGKFLNNPTMTERNAPIPENTKRATTAAFRGASEETNEFEPPGKHIDQYEILGVLGEGGFGCVYLAQQHEPISRKVALKILKPGAGIRVRNDYFRAEQQLLAMLAHPNIAAVFDAGQTSDMRPYFVMELIRGTSLTQYCIDRTLTVRERLLILLDVCRGVSHAHAKGVIHRDLKPSNIIVATFDGRPQPKVIDFGIARAFEVPGQSEPTAMVKYRMGGGTLQYLSPEQADLNAASGDVQSDVYALGIVLFELLTETKPLTDDQLESPREKILELIKSSPQPALRTRLGSEFESAKSIDHDRADRLLAVSREVNIELEWVVAKAIAKDRTVRYDSISTFAQDIQRLLSNDPVLAGPRTFRYVGRKFLHRHRGAVAATSLLATALLAGTVTTTIEWLRERSANQELQTQFIVATDAKKIADQKTVEAEREKQIANQQAARASGFAFIVNRAVQVGNPLNISRQPATVLELIASIRAEVDAAKNLPDDVKGPINIFIARAMLANTDMVGARNYAQLGANQIQVAMPGSEEEFHAKAVLAMAQVLSGRLREARATINEIAPRFSVEPRPSHEVRQVYVTAKFALALGSGDLNKADELSRLLVADAAGEARQVSPTLLATQLLRSVMLVTQNRVDEATALLHRAQLDAHRVLGDDHGMTLQIDFFAVALGLKNAGPAKTAEEVESLLPKLERLYGPGSATVATSYLLLAFCHKVTGDNSAADLYAEKAVRIVQDSIEDPGPLQMQMKLFGALIGGDNQKMLDAIVAMDVPSDDVPPDVDSATVRDLIERGKKATAQMELRDYSGVVQTLEPFLKNVPLWPHISPAQSTMYIVASGNLVQAYSELGRETDIAETTKRLSDQLLSRFTKDSIQWCMFIRMRWQLLLIHEKRQEMKDLIDHELPQPAEAGQRTLRSMYTMMEGVTLELLDKHDLAKPLLEEFLNYGVTLYVQPADVHAAAMALERAYRATNEQKLADEVVQKYHVPASH